MGKPKLLDLFCGAGGAARGYQRAGFYVVGIDLCPQPNYCGDEFIQADAFDSVVDLMRFDAIHASPPCQGYTVLRNAPGALGGPRLISRTRGLLQATGKPWIIENVEAARPAMRNPLLLCGSMFGLKSQGCELRRHRLFESNLDLSAPTCNHTDGPVVGVYGGHARKRSAKHGGRGTRDVWLGGHRAAVTEAMGMDWGTLTEISEAIPPAYTEFLGRQLLKSLSRE